MSKQEEHYNRISDYLDGNLNQLEEQALESELLNDPALKEELDLQKMTIEGIQQKRRLQLKKRLSQVNPAPTNLGVKVAAILSLAGLITVGGYFVLRDTLDISLPSPTNAPKHEHADYNQSITDQTSIQANQKIELESDEYIKPPIAQPTDDSHIQTEHIEASTKKAVPVIIEQPKPITDSNLEVIVPNVDDELDDLSTNKQTTPNDQMVYHQEVPQKAITDVRVIRDKKYNFHYKFHDGRLYLYGDFSAGPYEILELNTPGEQKYFMVFLEEYYTLHKNQTEVRKLEPVRNAQIIRELQILVDKQM